MSTHKRQMPSASTIPAGEYCYEVVDLRESEVLRSDLERFGEDLREAGYSRGTKRVLCPHWRRSRHGTIRCEFLGLEVLDESDRDARRKAAEHFGLQDLERRVEHSSWLADEIKICDTRMHEDKDA